MSIFCVRRVLIMICSFSFDIYIYFFMHVIPTFIRICCIAILLNIRKSDVFVFVSIHCMFMPNSPSGGNKIYVSIYILQTCYKYS